MSLVRKPAPQFEGIAWYRGNFKTLKLSDYKGKYLVLFFYPLNFTFVCPTQIIAFSGMMQQFSQVQCSIIACSVDSKYGLMEYTLKSREQGGIGQIQIPLLSDVSQKISKSYGCLIQQGESQGVSLRATYIIDRNGIIRHVSITDLPVGRDSQQILRLVKAFQFNDIHGEPCSMKWSPQQKQLLLNKNYNNSETADFIN